jgi:hypothetical protein
MSGVKLRPWKFPVGKKIRLYWICSPYRQSNGNWTVRAVFQAIGSSDLEIIDFPWGTLPALTTGWYYVDGLPVEPIPGLLFENLFVPKLNDGKTIDAFDINGKFHHFRQSGEIAKERVWKFINYGATYFLPCLELLRAFLLPSKTLTNLILRPNGLESVIDDEKVREGTLEIYLNKEVPQRIVTHQNVAHLVWLLYNPTVKVCWDSVYRNIFTESLERSASSPTQAMSAGLPITFEPPDIGSCRLSVDAVSGTNERFITRINGFSLENFPFETVIYSHPSIKEKKTFKSRTKQPRLIKEDFEDDFSLDEERRAPRHDSNQPIVNASKVYFDFNLAPRLIKLPQGQALIPVTGNSSDSEGGKSNKAGRDVSTDEPIYGGQIQPVEFSALQVSLHLNEGEFDEFFEAVAILKTKNPHLEVEFTIIDILGIGDFCFIKRKRRKCLVVKISQNGVTPCFVFEVARPDKWLISTLFIRFEEAEPPTDNVEHNVAKVLFNMVSESGHWCLEKFATYALHPILLRHFSVRNSHRWAERIVEKLNEFDFNLK